MEKKTLNIGEFAIKEAAILSLVDASPTLKITKDGAVTMSFQFKIGDSSCLQVAKKNDDPLGIGVWGVFNETMPDNLVSADVKNISLSITSDAIPKVVLSSANSDINLVTNGGKGNHGTAIM